jgi:polynucleotide 5'-kinase involved in rRNA processing
MTVRIKLEPPEVLLVKGPARLQLDGSGSVLGRPIGSTPLVIRRGKTLPVETQTGADIDLALGTAGEYQVVHAGAGTAMWQPAASQLVKDACRRELTGMVTGATDAGKSTLSVFLANLAVAEGLRTVVVDGDLGQTDLGPPGSVAATPVRAPLFDLRDLQGEAFGFVGATSPRGFEWLLTRELTRLCKLVRDQHPDFVIVNTDGDIHGEGATQKLRLIAELRPNVVLTLEDKPAQLAAQITEAFPHMAVRRLDRPSVPAKSQAERALRRTAQYRRFLRGQMPRRVFVQDLDWEFLGWEFTRAARGLHPSARSWPVGRAGSDSRRLVIRSGALPVVSLFGRDVVLTAGSIVGMFVALGSLGRIEGFGVVTAIHPTRGIVINTPAKATLERIILSVISLAPDQSTDSMLPLELAAP